MVAREDETHICIASPQQLLARVESEGGDNRGNRLPARWREELTTQLVGRWVSITRTKKTSTAGFAYLVPIRIHGCGWPAGIVVPD